MADTQVANGSQPSEAERIVAEGLRTGSPVRMEDLAAAIKQMAPAPAGVSDGRVIKAFAAANPHLGLDKLNIDMPEAATPQAAPTAPAQAKPEPSFFERAFVNPAKEVRSGYLAGMGKFYNTLANLAPVALGAGGLAPTGPSSAAMGVSDALRKQGAAFTQKSTQVLPNEETFSSPLYRGLGSAVPSIATYAPAMAAGPAAPLVMGATGALEEADKGFWPAVQGGVGAAATGTMLGWANKVPGFKKILFAGSPGAAIELWHGIQAGLPATEIMKNMTASGVTMAALTGMDPSTSRTVIGEVARLAKATPSIRNPLRKVGNAIQEAIAPLPKTIVLREAAPSADVPVTAPPPGAPPAAAGPALSARAQSVIDLMTRETATNPKFKASPTGIAKDLGIDKVTAARVYAELRQQGKLDANGALAGATTAPPSAPPMGPPPVATASTPTPEQVAAAQSAFSAPPPPDQVAPTQSETPPDPAAQIAANEAKMAQIQRLMDAAKAGTPPPAEAPVMTSKPTADSPDSAAVQVSGPPPPAAAPPEVAPPPVVTAPPPAPPENSTGWNPSSEAQVPPAPSGKGVIQPQTAVSEGAGAQPSFETDLAALKGWASNLVKSEAGTQYYDWRKPTEPGHLMPEELMRAAKNVGRHYFEQGKTNFEAWKNEMVSKIGPWVEGHLMPIWLQITSTQAPPVGADRPSAGSVPPGTAPAEGTALPPAPPPLFAGRTPRTWKETYAPVPEPPTSAAPGKPPLIPRPLEGEQLQQALREAGLDENQVPSIEHNAYTAEQALTAAGFQERNVGQKLGGIERPRAGGKFQNLDRDVSPRGPIAKKLPVSGQLAEAVWVKPVANGVIEIQMNPGVKVSRNDPSGKPTLVSNEFTATKYDNNTGAARTISGLGLGEMIDYLNHVTQNEAPLRASQMVGRSTAGRSTETAHIITDRPPAAPVSAEDAASQQLMQTLGLINTPNEAQSVLENVQARAATPEKGAPYTKAHKLAQKLAEFQNENARLKRPSASLEREESPVASSLPPQRGVSELFTPGDTEVDLAEKNASAFAALPVPRIQQIIAEAGTHLAVGRGGTGKDFSPLPSRNRSFAPQDMPTPGRTSPPPSKMERVKLPADSFFEVRTSAPGLEAYNNKTGAGGKSWTVGDKLGNDTDIHIDQVKTDRYEIKIGNNVIRAKSSLLAAKMDAISLAESRIYEEAEKNPPVHVEGVGTYSPLGEMTIKVPTPTKDGTKTVNRSVQFMHYQFTPANGGPTVQHAIPLKELNVPGQPPLHGWDHIQQVGTPANPFEAPKRPVGRPPKRESPPIKMAPPPKAPEKPYWRDLLPSSRPPAKAEQHSEPPPEMAVR